MKTVKVTFSALVKADNEYAADWVASDFKHAIDMQLMPAFGEELKTFEYEIYDADPI